MTDRDHVICRRAGVKQHTDSFQTYESLKEDDAVTREYVVHGGGEYVDRDVQVNTCEVHELLVRFWLSPH